MFCLLIYRFDLRFSLTHSGSLIFTAFEGNQGISLHKLLCKIHYVMKYWQDV